MATFDERATALPEPDTRALSIQNSETGVSPAAQAIQGSTGVLQNVLTLDSDLALADTQDALSGVQAEELAFEERRFEQINALQAELRDAHAKQDFDRVAKSLDSLQKARLNPVEFDVRRDAIIRQEITRRPHLARSLKSLSAVYSGTASARASASQLKESPAEKAAAAIQEQAFLHNVPPSTIVLRNAEAARLQAAQNQYAFQQLEDTRAVDDLARTDRDNERNVVPGLQASISSGVHSVQSDVLSEVLKEQAEAERNGRAIDDESLLARTGRLISSERAALLQDIADRRLSTEHRNLLIQDFDKQMQAVKDLSSDLITAAKNNPREAAQAAQALANTRFLERKIPGMYSDLRGWMTTIGETGATVADMSKVLTFTQTQEALLAAAEAGKSFSEFTEALRSGGAEGETGAAKLHGLSRFITAENAEGIEAMISLTLDTFINKNPNIRLDDPGFLEAYGKSFMARTALNLHLNANAVESAPARDALQTESLERALEIATGNQEQAKRAKELLSEGDSEYAVFHSELKSALSDPRVFQKIMGSEKQQAAIERFTENWGVQLTEAFKADPDLRVEVSRQEPVRDQRIREPGVQIEVYREFTNHEGKVFKTPVENDIRNLVAMWNLGAGLQSFWNFDIPIPGFENVSNPIQEDPPQSSTPRVSADESAPKGGGAGNTATTPRVPQ